VDDIERTPAQEKARLLRVYGPKVVELLYPGANPGMEMSLPEGAQFIEPAPEPAPVEDAPEPSPEPAAFGSTETGGTADEDVF